MHLRAMGGLELEPAHFSQPKPLLLLAYLALEGAQQRRHLAELFWQDGNRMKSLSMTLTRLRQGAGSVVEADQHRAWATSQSDVAALLRALDGGHWQRAAELYQGAFLEGVALPEGNVELEEWVYTTREYLAERVQHALLTLSEQAAHQRDFARAASLAERAYRLPGAGPADPSVLKRLYMLLCAGQSLRAPAVRKELESYGLELMLSSAEARAALAPPAGAPPHNLTARGTSFVGREAELKRIAALLARPGCRLLSLLGPGGTGKTRLAQQVAQGQLDQGSFPDGVYMVMLEALTEARQVPAQLAQTLGLGSAGPGAQAQGDGWHEVAEAIADRRMFLVLDNFEQLTGAAPALSDLLRACPNLRLLVTSRERLALAEEQLFPLDGLTVPDEGASWPEALAHGAVQLFAERARQLRPGLDLEAELPQVVRICRSLGGLPLGLELAAGWVRFLPCRDIAAELEAHPDFLTSTLRQAPARHRSLRAVFETSWKLLSPGEQAALRKLAVFHGGFRREAAAEVAGATLGLLAALADKSLLRTLPGGRYDRHPLLYQYMRERLAADPQEQSQTEERHRHYYLRLLQRQNALHEAGRQNEVIGTLRDEWQNIGVILERSLADEDFPAIEAFVEVMYLSFEIRGALREGLGFLERLEAVLADSGPGRGALLGRVRIEMAWYHYRLGNFAEAEQATRVGLDCLPAQGAEAVRAKGINTLGHVARATGDQERAAAHFAEARARAREAGDDAMLASVLGSLGVLEGERGARERAARYFEEAVALHRKDNRILSAIRELGNLAITYGMMDDMVRSGELMEESLKLAREIDFKQTMPYTLSNLGVHYARLGDHARAQALNLEALAVAEETGQREIQVGILNNLVEVAAELDGPDRALDYSSRALTLARALGTVPRLLQCLAARAELEARLQRPDTAAKLARVVLAHPATVDYARRNARALLDTLVPQLSPAQARAAEEFARTTPPQDVVSRLLAGDGA